MRNFRRCALAVGLLAGGVGQARGQDSLPAPTPTPAPAPANVAQLDSLVIPAGAPTPLGALLRSFAVPGWGQSRLNRKLTGGIFVAWEGVTLGMTLKTRRELGYLRRTGSGNGDAKRQEHEDWLVLLVFNHLFSGLEAYVSAHLTDFPDDLRIRAVPTPGGTAMTLSIPFRVR